VSTAAECQRVVDTGEGHGGAARGRRAAGAVDTSGRMANRTNRWDAAYSARMCHRRRMRRPGSGRSAVSALRPVVGDASLAPTLHLPAVS
jgi:hypothetical protein